MKKLLSLLLWAVAPLVVAPIAATGDADKKIVLFNGKNLDGWIAEGAKDYKDGDKLKEVWSVKDGLLDCDGKGFGFLRYAKQEFADFHFHLEYRLAEKCNSGVGIRTVPFDPKRSKDSRPSYACYEIQLIDDGKPPSKTSTGSLYRYVAPSSAPQKKAGEWNTLDIECVGPKIKVQINGEKIIDFDQSTDDKLKKNPTKGYVCVQNHGGKVAFRNLWVREIKVK
jgi:hypothetical protein